MQIALRRRLILALLVATVFASLSLLVAVPLRADDSGAAAGVAGMAMAGLFGLFMFVFFVAVYVYVALAFQTIAKKTNTPDAWWAWVPIMNLLLLAKIAKKEVWWGLLCMIPFVGIIFAIILMMGVAEARNKPNWWGILMIVPVLGLAVPGYLAWSD
jgi:hypothetical protein